MIYKKNNFLKSHLPNMLLILIYSLRKYHEGRFGHFAYTRSNLQYDICAAATSTVTKALSLSDLLGTFIVFVTGILSSIFVFIIELSVSYKINIKE